MARIRTTSLLSMKQNSEKITVLTAYDYLTACILDECGIDVLLVGDSVAMTLGGEEDTLHVDMDMMVYHTRLVSRAAKHALVVSDMPFLSYQVSDEDALRNAGRLVSEGGAHCIKLEGPAEYFGSAITTIIRAGIPVMGHIGLTPQSVHQIGGYKVQGRNADARDILIRQAMGLQEIGCFALVLELIQADVAAEITRTLTIPTIGIGSGAACDGQVLVTPDMLGFGPPRKFCKVYADLREGMRCAVNSYIKEVREAEFPDEEHTHR